MADYQRNNAQPMRAYFYLSRKRINSRGCAPVYCRVVSEHDRSDFSTGIFIPVSEWKEDWSKIQYNRCGQRLNTCLQRVYKSIAESEATGIVVACEAVRAFKAEKKNLVFLKDIIAEFIERLVPSERVAKRLAILIEQLKDLTGATIAIQLNDEVLRRFERALITEGYSMQTVFKKLQLLKRLLKYSAGRGIIKQNPFDTHRLPKVPRVVLVQLDEVEIGLMAGHRFASQRLEQVRDLFLFQCYTGLSYSDLSSFGAHQVLRMGQLSYLKGERCKTGEEFTAPWLKQAECIAVKYDYRLPQLSNQKYNAYLKEVAEIVGIEKKISSHVGRKTFAQMMIDKGYTAEAVSRMVGHASFAMTQKHYARIGDTRVLNEIRKMVG